MTHSSKGRRRLRIGPGTIIAIIVGSSVAFATGLLDKPGEASDKVYRVDSLGRAHEAGGATPEDVPPLLKPEPSYIAEYADKLALKGPQVARIQGIDKRWQELKKQLLSQMQVATKQLENTQGTREQSQLSSSAIAIGLQEYSELSRRYERLRVAFWEEAVFVLEPGQVTELHTLLKEVRP